VIVHQARAFLRTGHHTVYCIPSGSGNDFARSNRIPLDTNEAIEHLFTVKEAQKVSIIEAREGPTKHYAVNSFGVGLDGRMINNLSLSSYKKNLGPMTYISQLYSTFKNQDKFPITLSVDEGIYRYENAQIALIANNPYLGGGIKALPEATAHDDTLDILVADDVGAKDFFPIVYRLLTNKSHLKHPKLHNFKSKKVALFTEADQYAQKDGEPIHQQGYAYIFNTIHRHFWI
jgi:diacylglycerol kinase family enzyme